MKKWLLFFFEKRPFLADRKWTSSILRHIFQVCLKITKKAISHGPSSPFDNQISKGMDTINGLSCRSVRFYFFTAFFFPFRAPMPIINEESKKVKLDMEKKCNHDFQDTIWPKERLHNY